ncbi:MAG: ABC transporter ATP-binding protein [Crenarchaeota archaeon]|nr:ABC transporter ATP-binding protein [Thermoproteota archaeon]
MVEVIVRDLLKKFGSVVAVDRVSFNVKHGEFLTLLGPSGCGKTTTLRCIAGLEIPDDGEIRIGEKIVSAPRKGIFVPPEKRNIGMVFQNYAVWPHMTVFDNIAYPLKIRRLPKDEIRRRVKRVLELVHLEGLENRYPHQLSGGQQQRVALARALVMEPEVLLLDEPLSNLDAKLREEMRFEIKEIQRRVGITVIYVTHDQAEAMAMSDKIAVMNKGRILQIGTPTEIYRKPANAFVAEFIGLANFLEYKSLRFENNRVSVELKNGVLLLCSPPVKSSDKYVVVVRPSDIEISKEPLPGSIPGTIVKATFLGGSVDYRVDIGGQVIRVESKGGELMSPGSRVYLVIRYCVLAPL